MVGPLRQIGLPALPRAGGFILPRPGDSLGNDGGDDTPEPLDAILKSLQKQQQGRGVIGNLFDILDRPGAAVRGLLAGRPGELKNLIPFGETLEELTGLDLYTPPEERTTGYELLEQIGIKNKPGFDLVDVMAFGTEMVADPLTFVTGPARHGIKLAGTAGEAAGRIASRKMAEGLVKKAGLEVTEKSILDFLPQAEKAVSKISLIQGKGAKKIASMLPEVQSDIARKLTARGMDDVEGLAGRLAERTIARDLLNEAVEYGEREMARRMPGVFDLGGIKVGLPFTPGRTIVAGETVQRIMKSSANHIGAMVKWLPGGESMLKFGGKMADEFGYAFKRFHGMSHGQRRMAQNVMNSSEAIRVRMIEEASDLLKGPDGRLLSLDDQFEIIEAIDTTTGKSLEALRPDLIPRAQGLRNILDRIRKAEGPIESGGLGILEQSMSDYVPQFWKNQDRFHQLVKEGKFKGLSSRNRHSIPREITLAEGMEYGLEPVRSMLERMTGRINAYTRSLSNTRMKRQLNMFWSLPESLTEGAVSDMLSNARKRLTEVMRAKEAVTGVTDAERRRLSSLESTLAGMDEVGQVIEAETKMKEIQGYFISGMDPARVEKEILRLKDEIADLERIRMDVKHKKSPLRAPGNEVEEMMVQRIRLSEEQDRLVEKMYKAMREEHRTSGGTYLGSTTGDPYQYDIRYSNNPEWYRELFRYRKEMTQARAVKIREQNKIIRMMNRGQPKHSRRELLKVPRGVYIPKDDFINAAYELLDDTNPMSHGAMLEGDIWGAWQSLRDFEKALDEDLLKAMGKSAGLEDIKKVMGVEAPAYSKVRELKSALKSHKDVLRAVKGIEAPIIKHRMRAEKIQSVIKKITEGADARKAVRLERLTKAEDAAVAAVEVVQGRMKRLQAGLPLDPNALGNLPESVLKQIEVIAQTGKRASTEAGRAFRKMTRGVVKPLLTSWNPAFHGRNFISGFSMAATDPNVGMKVFSNIDKTWTNSFRTAVLNKPPSGIVRTMTGVEYTFEQLRKFAEDYGVFFRDQVTQETLENSDRLLGRVLGKIKGKVPVTRAFAQNTEKAMRMNAFVHNVRAGMSLEDAATATRKYFIDYAPASSLEETLRDVIPFFKFSREAVPTYLGEMTGRPRIANALSRAFYGKDDDEPDEFLPQFLWDQARVKLGRSPDGSPIYLAGLGLVFDDISQKLSGGGLARWVEKNILAQLNPVFKWPLEAITGRSFYSGEEKRRFRYAPDALVALQEKMGVDVGVKKVTTKAGKTYHVMDDGVSDIVNFFWSDLPTGRMLQSIDRLLRKDQGAGLKLLNTFTGVKVYTVDQEKTRRRVLEHVLKKLADERPDDVRTFVRVYATGAGKTDPKIKALIGEYARAAQGARTDSEAERIASQLKVVLPR